MVRRFAALAFAPLLAVLLWPAVGRAQESSTSEYQGAPAHVSFVEGSVTLEREGRLDDAPANMPLQAGDRLRTRVGRAEVLFADGSTMHLDRETTLDLQSDELVRLIAGRLRLSIPGPSSRQLGYRIDTASGWAHINEAGDYRAALVRDEFELAVLRGRAELVNDSGRTSLRAGERAFARTSAAPSYAYVFNSAAWDEFDRWSEERRSERLGLSTQYLPEEVRSYAATFDRDGSWSYDTSYGYVWYPRVAVGWRPYYYGRWLPYRHYGYTWVSTHPWGWATHHYGRWGFSAGAWFWIPGRTWGPAWVSWGYAPGYVSWCPLGWNNRPVLYAHHGYYKGYDHWRAWTVVPHHSFAGSYVNRTVVPAHRIDERTRLAFNYGDRPPPVVGRAVPRGSVAAAPIRVAGTAPVRTAGSTVLTNRQLAAGTPGSTPQSRRAAPNGHAVGRSAVSRTEPAAPALSEARRAESNGSEARRAESNGSEARRAESNGSNAPTVNRPAVSRTEPTAPGLARSTGRNEPSRSSDLPISQRNDGYRARPETYAPAGNRAVPRVPSGSPAPVEIRRGVPSTPAPSEVRGSDPRGPSYGAPPSYGTRPSYGSPSGPSSQPRTAQPRGSYGPPPSHGSPSSARPSGPGAPSAQPPAPGGPDRGAARPEGSRPGGGAPARGAARPRGGL